MTHALPFTLEELQAALRADPGFAPHADRLDAFGRALEALFHAEFLQIKRRVQRGFTRLERRDGASGEAGASGSTGKALLADLEWLLARANFVPVTLDELSEAMRVQSSFGLRIDLDVDDFDQLAMWRRRETVKRGTIPIWFGFRRRAADVVVYDRFCLFAHMKDAGSVPAEKVRAQKLGWQPGGVALRLFQEVPKHDVEALFPAVRVRMTRIDRWLLSLPAAAGALHLLIFKLGVSLGGLGLAALVLVGLRKDEPKLHAEAVAGLVALGVLGMFLMRQWSRFVGKKNSLHRQLAELLQTCTLDTGAGVLFHLLDEAEEEETLEALLGYAFLLRAAEPLPLAELDRRIEAWLAERMKVTVDFEEGDALAKLERLGLVTKDGAGKLCAVALPQALERLAEHWSGLLDLR